MNTELNTYNDMSAHFEIAQTSPRKLPGKPTPCVQELVHIISGLGGEARLVDIYNEHQRRFPDRTFKDDSTRRASIRSKLQNHSERSKQSRSACPNLFENSSKGVWKLVADVHQTDVSAVLAQAA